MKIEELLDHFINKFENIFVEDATTGYNACWSQVDAAGDIDEDWEETEERIAADLDEFLKDYDDYEVVNWECENSEMNELWVMVKKK